MRLNTARQSLSTRGYFGSQTFAQCTDYGIHGQALTSGSYTQAGVVSERSQFKRKRQDRLYVAT